MDRVRIAIIGCGGLGRTHAECLKRIAGAELTAYADISEEAAAAMLRDFGGSYATSDNTRVIEDDAIDAVYICTHHDSHADLCLRAARAGKHIMVEKPLALTVEECRQVGQAVLLAHTFHLESGRRIALRRGPAPKIRPHQRLGRPGAGL